ncbi:hypothetical protein BSZ35_09130 [Salinibacter sp. 10B]|nr:hypothetical protein BSZ35_09130 [Salinibacter sp. 10B]
MSIRQWVRKVIQTAKILEHPCSFETVLRLRKAGRTGGSRHPEEALPLNLRGLDFPLYCRPGTSDYVTFQEIFVQDGGEYTDFLPSVREPVEYILDLGTNVGFSIGFFVREWPQAQVTGVEPYTPNVRMAEKSLAPLIESGQVTICHALVGTETGQAALASGGAGGANELRKCADPSSESREILERVPVRPVTEILDEERPEGAIDILKCDIEGGEGEVFSKCAPWIHRVRHLVVELHEGRDETWLQDRLRENGGRFDLRGVQQGYGDAVLVWFRSEDQ